MKENNTVSESRIIWSSPSALVAYKNAGEICEALEPESRASLVSIIRNELALSGHVDLEQVTAVHRIDRPVTGCTLFALTAESASALSRQFSQGTIRKRYLAIVELSSFLTDTQSGKLEHWIRFDSKTQKSRILPLCETPRSPGWKKASLSWRLAGKGDHYAFLEIDPHTGRTHQIRAQLAFEGIPIKGDLKYGARRSERSGGIRLHAYMIQFTDISSGERITVQSSCRNPDALWSAFPGLDS
ncbi:MAG: RNA pseudouridine synthase [Spirochaetales bacterium]|nr:RNA pseudouridine synthase [Spirochaetales bacterium]